MSTNRVRSVLISEDDLNRYVRCQITDLTSTINIMREELARENNRVRYMAGEDERHSEMLIAEQRAHEETAAKLNGLQTRLDKALALLAQHNIEIPQDMLACSSASFVNNNKPSSNSPDDSSTTRSPHL